MNIPNLLSIVRLLMVPVIVWAISVDLMVLAFWLFVLASISDVADGVIAKKFNQITELGKFLDPLADKAMLVSIFVTVSIVGLLDSWLVITVVARDILIVTAVVLSWLINQPLTMRPLFISKVNTCFQIGLVGVILGEASFEIMMPGEIYLVVLTGLMTIISAAAYLISWLRHLASSEKS